MHMFFNVEVDGKDLRNAAHDQAVDIIRHAKSPVKFVVQSLCDPACVSALVLWFNTEVIFRLYHTFAH